MDRCPYWLCLRGAVGLRVTPISDIRSFQSQFGKYPMWASRRPRFLSLHQCPSPSLHSYLYNPNERGARSHRSRSHRSRSHRSRSHRGLPGCRSRRCAHPLTYPGSLSGRMIAQSVHPPTAAHAAVWSSPSRKPALTSSGSTCRSRRGRPWPSGPGRTPRRLRCSRSC